MSILDLYPLPVGNFVCSETSAHWGFINKYWTTNESVLRKLLLSRCASWGSGKLPFFTLRIKYLANQGFEQFLETILNSSEGKLEVVKDAKVIVAFVHGQKNKYRVMRAFLKYNAFEPEARRAVTQIAERVLREDREGIVKTYHHTCVSLG